MGKGIALMFKKRFMDNFCLYAAACERHEVMIGKMFVTEPCPPRWIVNFPTKQHWRFPSQMIWVCDGLIDLRRFIIENQVKSIAIPPLGCGCGGLSWPLVRYEIVKALGDLDAEIFVYEPEQKVVLQ